jgi:hypothetical protein
VLRFQHGADGRNFPWFVCNEMNKHFRANRK